MLLLCNILHPLLCLSTKFFSPFHFGYLAIFSSRLFYLSICLSLFLPYEFSLFTWQLSLEISQICFKLIETAKSCLNTSDKYLQSTIKFLDKMLPAPNVAPSVAVWKTNEDLFMMLLKWKFVLQTSIIILWSHLPAISHTFCVHEDEVLVNTILVAIKFYNLTGTLEKPRDLGGFEVLQRQWPSSFGHDSIGWLISMPVWNAGSYGDRWLLAPPH